MGWNLKAWITAMTFLAGLAAQDQPELQAQNQKHHWYKLVDIGTFGGPASAFNQGASLNNHGMGVGASETPIPDTPTSNGYPCGPGSFVYHAFEWRNGVVTDLGTLSGPGHCSNAEYINERGDAVGNSEIDEIDPVLGVNEIRAALWKDGHIIDLGVLEGGTESATHRINNREQVIGFSVNDTPDPYSFFFPLGQTRAFLWEKGVMRDLGTLGGPDAEALFVNDRGQVAGNSYTNSAPNATTGIPTLDPFLWENGKMRDLGTLGGTIGFPVGLNNQGQVIGGSMLADQETDPFLWDRGELIDLRTTTIGGTPISVNAINDTGTLVGGGVFPGRAFDAYVWRNGKATDLGTLDDDCYSEAWGINSGGQVVGISLACDFSNLRPFLWDNGSIIDLNARVPADSSLQAVWAYSINDREEIVGIGVPPGVLWQDTDSSGHAYVLIPCHENDALGCEDRGEGISATTQSNPAPANQKSMTVTQSSPTSREIMAQIHARLPQRNQIPGLGARQAK